MRHVQKRINRRKKKKIGQNFQYRKMLTSSFDYINPVEVNMMLL